MQYVRAALVKSSGSDVNPTLVEEEVKREITELKAKRKHEEEMAEMAEAPEPEFMGNGRQWIDKTFSLGRFKRDPSAPKAKKIKKSAALEKPDQ